MKNAAKFLALACAATVMLTACGNNETPPANQGGTSVGNTVSTPNNSTPDTASAPVETSTPDTTSTPEASSVPDSTPDTTSTSEAPGEIDWSTVPYTYFINAVTGRGGFIITGYEGDEKVVNFPPKMAGSEVTAIILENGNFDFTDVNIPDTVTEIGDDDFKLCTNLKSVNIPDSVTKIGTSAFSNCPDIKVKYNGKEYDFDHIDSLYSAINGN